MLCQVQSWAQQQGERIRAVMATAEAEREEVQRLLDWISSAEESLHLRDQEPLPEDMEQMEELITQHAVLTDITNQTQAHSITLDKSVILKRGGE